MLRGQYLLVAVLAGLAAVVFWSCDRMEGTVSTNQPPVVHFVNVPQDSTQFNYAPTVHWYGYDPDGLITGYQFRDDQSEAALAAYRGGDATLNAYLASLTAQDFVFTENTQETIYLLTAEGDTAEHVFIVRSVDDRGAFSQPKVRIFFRTNQAPNTPEIKKIAQDAWERDLDYNSALDLTSDTLYIGESPNLTWPGIQFLWKGTDPDSRELNLIPLEFSYRLTNVTRNEVMPFYRMIDSTRGDWIVDWSDWRGEAQTTFSQSTTAGLMETGEYLLEVRVRDDGLTESDTIATARFYAIRPTFERQLLIVDENKPLLGADAQMGGRSDAEILTFYYDLLPGAFELAEMLRPIVDDDRNGMPDITEPFVYDTSAGGPVQWFRNKTTQTHIPLSLIHQFKWVWIIDDDNPTQTHSDENIRLRQKSMGWYMNMGGQVMISGRRIFQGSYNISGDVNACGHPYGRFFCRYFDVQALRGKQAFSVNDPLPGNNVADFGGASGSNPMLPSVEVDTSVARSLLFQTQRYECLPQVDYFNRSSGQSGYDYSETLYSYESCTANLSYNATNWDNEIVSSTQTQAILYADSTGTPVGSRRLRVLDVSRVYNVTRGVSGEFMGLRAGVSGRPEIVVSTPVQPDVTVADVDARVLQSDTTQAVLSPDGCTNFSFPIRDVTRVYNVTRNAYGTVTDVRQVNSRWSVIVSTPREPDQSTTDADFRVMPNASANQAVLSPDTACQMHTNPITEVTRVHNVTLGVTGTVTSIQYNVSRAQWEVTVSTPGSSRAWTTADVLQVDYSYAPKWTDCDVLQVDYTHTPRWTDCDILEVDYTYIPIAINHSQPVAARFIRIEGIVDVDFNTGDFRFIGETRFRSSIFTFPLSFLDPTPKPIPILPQFGLHHPAKIIVATQLLFFNSVRRFDRGRDDNM